MKTILTRKWNGYESGTEIRLSNRSNRWIISADDTIIAHKDAIDPTLIRQVPEVGKDYIVFNDDNNRPPNITKFNLYKIFAIEFGTGEVTFYFTNDIGKTDTIQQGCYYFIRGVCRFATPEEIEAWLAKEPKKSREQKVIDDIWGIVNSFKEGK